MLDALSIALSGLTAQKQRLAVTASNVANVSTEGYKPLEARLSSQTIAGEGGAGVTASVGEKAGSDSVDLSEEAVNLIVTKAAFKANLAVIKTQDEMTSALLDVLA